MARSVTATEGGERLPETFYKIVFIGNIATGKTSIIQRYVNNRFSNSYKSTIGVDFALKRIKNDNGSMLNVQLWDLAGQERFANLTSVYYKGSHGAIVVHDVTKQKDLESIRSWKDDLDKKIIGHCRSPVPTLLLLNKIDLRPDWLTEEYSGGITNSEYITLQCKQLGIAQFYLTSAKTDDHNIEVAMNSLYELIEKDPNTKLDQAIPSTIDLARSEEVDEESTSSCCKS